MRCTNKCIVETLMSLILLVSLAGSPAQSQVLAQAQIDTSKLQNKTPLPTNTKKGVDANSIPEPITPFTIAAGASSQQTIRFATEFALPSGSSRLSFVVRLVDRNGDEVDRTTRNADLSDALVELRGRPLESFTRDLAISDVTMNYKRARLDVGPVNVARALLLKSMVTISNAGTERWGYSASLSVSYQRGQPGAWLFLHG
jgi:hypothetical protein